MTAERPVFSDMSDPDVEIRVEIYTYVHSDTEQTVKKLYMYVVAVGQYEEEYHKVIYFISSLLYV